MADTEALVKAASDDQDGRALSTRELIKAIRYATQLIKPTATSRRTSAGVGWRGHS